MKKNLSPPEKKEKYVFTTDDWYSTYPNKQVRVRFCQLPVNRSIYRVCVWGADDFGMERDFDSRVDALEMFNSIQDSTTIKELENLNFQKA